MAFHFYNKALRPRARKLRNNSTAAEIRLWCELLRKRQMLNYQFLRQRPVDRYIADFMCKELWLILEVDGPMHSQAAVAERDKERDQQLSELGFSILRIPNDEIMFDIEGVRERIMSIIRYIEEIDADRLSRVEQLRIAWRWYHPRSRWRRDLDLLS